MGAALILPVVVLVMLGVIFGRRLRADHAEADPSLVTHPERRP